MSATPFDSSWSKYSANVRQLRSRAVAWLSSARVRSFCGASEPPSPAIIVVMPCRSLLSALIGSSRSGRLLPPIMSTNPGATTSPPTSITRAAVRSDRSPISAITPARIPTSAL